MAGVSGPDYDNVRLGGPDGLRYPLEAGRATFVVKKEVDLGTLASGSTTTLTPAQAQASLITATPQGACTLVFPSCLPGHMALILNLASTGGYTITVEISGNTSNTAVCPINEMSLIVHTGTNSGVRLGPAA
jgi:hypothetical protein